MGRGDTLRLLVKAAKLYYENGYSQQAIAEQLRISRPKVSRLLKQARQERIVQIKVVPPSSVFADLERQIELRFGLKEAIVVETADYDSQAVVTRDLGTAAAEYFSRVVRDGDVVALTWGRTLAATVDALVPERRQNVRVVQILGGLGEPSAEVHATGLARRVAEALGASLTLLPAPGIVDTKEARQILQADTHIREALELGRRADLTLVGIGAPTPGAVIFSHSNIITWDEVRTLINHGAVGDIALRFFDIHGNPVPSDIDERVIGIDLATLRTLPRVVGISGGREKYHAILGAVRGRFINVLVTDHITARKLLAESDRIE